MRTAACLLLALLPAITLAGPIYKHVDPVTGKVSYTDQPPENATEVSLPPVNAMQGLSAPPNRELAPAPAQPAEPEAAATEGYTELVLSSAGFSQGDLLRNPEGPFGVTAHVSPELQEGDRIQIFLNGALISETGSAELPADRGEHLVEAAVVDSTGNRLIEAEPLRFQVQRPFVKKPAAPAPKPKPKPSK